MKKMDVGEFYDSAKKLCDYLNNTIIRQENVDELIYLLVDVYGKGLLLPDVEPDDNRSHAKIPKQPDIQIELPTTYWEIFDPFTDKEPVCGDLLDDLTDTSDDLVYLLAEWDIGYVNNAVFEAKLLHHDHWGNHIVAAVKALQHFRENP